MNERQVLSRRLLWRTALVLILAAVLTDRIALYAWGFSVIRLYRGFCVPLPNSSTPVPLAFPMLGFGKEEAGGCRLDLLLYGSSARPDDIQVYRNQHNPSDCVLRLLFLPPRLAWSTRLFPWGRRGNNKWPSAFYYAYELRITEGKSCHLYRAVHRDGNEPPDLVEVQQDSEWPHFYL